MGMEREGKMEDKDLSYIGVTPMPGCCSIDLLWGVGDWVVRAANNLKETLDKAGKENYGIGKNYMIITNTDQECQFGKNLISLGFYRGGSFPSKHPPHNPCTVWLFKGVNCGKET